MISQDPKIWGGPAWRFLDAVVSSYPNDPSLVMKEEMIQFWKYLYLPCSTCKEHYRGYCNLFPIQEWVRSRDQLYKWYQSLRSYVESNRSIHNPHNATDTATETETTTETATETETATDIETEIETVTTTETIAAQTMVRRFQSLRRNQAAANAVAGGGIFRPTRNASRRHDPSKPQGVCTTCGGVSEIRISGGGKRK